MSPLRVSAYGGVVSTTTAISILAVVAWPTTLFSAMVIMILTFGFGACLMAALIGAKGQPWSPDPSEPPEVPQKRTPKLWREE